MKRSDQIEDTSTLEDRHAPDRHVPDTITADAGTAPDPGAIESAAQAEATPDADRQASDAKAADRDAGADESPKTGTSEARSEAGSSQGSLDDPAAGVDLRVWPDINLCAVEPAALVELVSAVDPGAAGSRESLGVVAACEQVIRRLSAVQARFTARAAEVIDPPDLQANGAVNGEELAVGELAFLLALSAGQARYRVSTALDMITDSARLVALVEAGDLDWKRATSIDEAMRAVLDPGSREWNLVQDVMSVAAIGATSKQIEAATRKAIDVIDPAAAAKRHTRAKADRQVVAFPLPDGMGQVSATLTADVVMMIDAVLDALADGCRDDSRAQGAPDPRHHQQRRADAFTSIFEAIGHGTGLPVILTNPDQPTTTHQTSTQPTSTQPTDAEPESTQPTGTEPAAAGPAVAEPTSTQPSSTDSTGTASETCGAADLVRFGGRYQSTDLSDPAAIAGRTLLGWWLPPGLRTQQGRRPHLVVTMTACTLAGHNDDPCDLSGYGPIPASMARKIAATASLCTTILLPDDPPSNDPLSNDHPAADHPAADRPPEEDRPPAGGADARDAGTGAAADTGPSASASASHGGRAAHVDDPRHRPGDQATCPNRNRPYRPTQGLTDTVSAWHHTCHHPGCGRRATACDLDHVKDYTAGGSTCICNLAPCCRFHHRLKTHGSWTARFTTPGQPFPAGTLRWVSLHGQVRNDPPTALPGTASWKPPLTTTTTTTSSSSGRCQRRPGTAHYGTFEPEPEPEPEPVRIESWYPDDASIERRTELRVWAWKEQLETINRKLGITRPPEPKPTTPKSTSGSGSGSEQSTHGFGSGEPPF